MRIVTVNLPVSYIEAIKSLTGDNGLYPSRSELIRVAVRDFLISEIKTAKSFQKYQKNSAISTTYNKVQKTEKLDENLFVKVPVGKTEYKTYKLVKR